MEYMIRRCEVRDLPAIIQLCAHHAEYEQAYYSPEGKLEKLEAAIFSATPRLHCYVIEADNKTGGYFSYTFDFSTWEAGQFLYLDCLFLEPGLRGQGIGKKVFDVLKTIALENNCVNIQWQTPEFNARAINFYKREGGIGKNKVRFSMKIFI